MAFNRTPLRKITAEDAETYARDGVVCLRQVFDRDWIASLKPFVERIMIAKEDFGLLPTCSNRYMTRVIPEFRRFIFESALGEACGRTLRSREVRFFFDEIFAKAPQSQAKTVWHNARFLTATHPDFLGCANAIFDSTKTQKTY